MKYSRKLYQAGGEIRDMEVTHHWFCLHGTEDEDSGPQGNAEVQEPGAKSGQVRPCLYFVSRMPLEKSKIRREGHLLNPYTHPSHTVPKQNEVTQGCYQVRQEEA